MESSEALEIERVVGAARERIDSRDVRPHRVRQQQRCDRKVFVVRSRQGLARRVGLRERPGRYRRHPGIVHLVNWASGTGAIDRING